MPPILSANGLSKEFAGRRLFADISLGIEGADRIGLIGPNGAGKSTLLKILAGQETADLGKVSRQNNLKVAYLPQVPTFDEKSDLLSIVKSGMSPGLEDWEQDVKAYDLLEMLNISEVGLSPESLISELSGGWRKRVAIAREWAKDPQLLFLDEPTNHLDVESILWLEEILLKAPYAYICITHDRLFLQRVTNKIMELDRRNPLGLLTVEGSYAEYLERKEALLSSQEQREWQLKNKLRRETEWLRRGPKARTTKQQARIDRAYDLGDEVQDLSAQNRKREVDLAFKAMEGGPKKLIEAVDISKRYGSRQLFDKFSITLQRKSRVGLLGTNGSGKSTLIKVLLGDLEPDSGLVKRADNLKAAYFEQSRSALNLDETLLKAVCPQGDHVKFQDRFVHVRSYLDRFLFSSDQIQTPLRKFSGGEQARVLVARLMLQEANILVLDEPTNDLDVATLDILQEQLESFEGSILLVSHDRYFMDQVCTEIYAFEDEKIVRYADLFQWEENFKNKAAKGSGNVKPAAMAPAMVAESPKSPAKVRLGFNETRELADMEKTIQKTEAELARLTEKSADSSLAPLERQKVFRELTECQNKIDTLYARWSELDGRK